MISRIYQGRATSLQVFAGDGHWSAPVAIGSPPTCPLWFHHTLFQDAVNYYLVALGALAGDLSGNRVIRDLRKRLDESWEKFPRGACASSLRDSLRRSLPGLAADATLEDAFSRILAGNEATEETRSLALSLLLAKCGGEAAIQQGGRGYFPRFCDENCNPTWDFSASSQASDAGKQRLAEILHGESSDAELAAIAEAMDLSWTVKLQPGKFFTGTQAKDRLTEAIRHLLKQLESPTQRLSDALADFIGEPRAILEEFLHNIRALPDDLAIPANRKAAPDLTFATIAFKHVPGQLTRRFLMLGVKAPKSTGRARPKTTSECEDFSRLGDDPIKLARGNRGYVFPAFTALEAWAPESRGLPVWKEFDIAAFKEALKALNQFNQKTIEREGKLALARAEFSFIIGETDVFTPPPGESERVPVRIGKEAWDLIRALEEELSENINEGEWRVSRASLRGFRDIADRWRKEPEASRSRLEDIVKSYQADEKNRREIGSVQLFLLLADSRYHALWKHDDSHDEDSGEAVDLLSAAAYAHRLENEIQRYQEPIRLTPAEPRESRRLFMFSDLKDKLAKIRHGTTDDGKPFIETAIAVREEGSRLSERRVRIIYSAPRLQRDELLGGVDSRWLQPMTRALGLPLPESTAGFDSACALMPQPDEDGTVRHLLNFPVSLETGWIHEAIGKAALWKNQFNGTRDSFLHLHWPGTEKDATKANRWWENPRFIEVGFTILANDLGQRSAGAWALLRVTSSKPDTKRPVHSIGNDGTREWFAEIVRTGMHRLPGEDQTVPNGGGRKTEPWGSKGRPAELAEYQSAIELAQELGAIEPASLLGPFGAKSFSELNDQLVRIANRRLTRLGTYHRWSCFDPDRKAVVSRKKGLLESLETELAGYEDAEVGQWAAKLEEGDVAAFREAASKAFADLRAELKGHLVALANRVCPIRRKTWHWLSRPESVYGDLIAADDREHLPKIRWQRGLSMHRLEQLENLRRLFLRFNRALDRKPGTPVPSGRNDRGRNSGEPCQGLLDKIDRMKKERVNLTAHLILAQALGVRLREHSTPEVERKQRDLHGEYEKIPGREPVDFIVMEDLSRYLSSQGRAPSENSRLMKWSHRAVRDKLKMLAEEPFGIPVVEVIPAYSSRFHAKNGQPGARLHELSKLESYQRRSLEGAAEKAPDSPACRLLAQFDELEDLNAARIAARKPPHTLFYPKSGGPLFLSVRDGSPVQADTNAAANLGLRAVASPESIAIHRRVRAKRQNETFVVRTDNAREKAAFSKDQAIHTHGELSSKFRKSTSPNFFFEPDNLRQPDGASAFDRAMLAGHPLVSGLSLWSLVNQSIMVRCVMINEERLKKWRDDVPM